MNHRFQSLQELGEQFERVASGEERTIGRFGAPRQFVTSLLSDARRGLWSAVAAGAVALSAAVAAVVVLLSAGAPAAYAGWTAVPASASPSAVTTAVHRCYRTAGSPGVVFGRPVLSETRGRSTAAVFVVGGSVYMCLYNAVLPDVEERSLGPLHAAPGPDRLSLTYGVYAGGGYGHLPKKLFQASKQRPMKRSTALALSNFDRGAGRGSWAVGRTGSQVSSVTFAFTGHKRVVASIQDGWYFAWWPWVAEPSSVKITTSSGTRTSPMGDSPRDGLGIRPYPACTPGTSGCVFVKTPEASQPTAGGAVAQATRICNQDTLDGHQLPADVFSGRPVLTDHHGVFTALLAITNHRVWVCLQGGYPNNLHRFEVDDIGAYGKVPPAPNPDRLSLPYIQDGGMGSGRQPPPRPFKGETLAQRRRQMLASMPARRARLNGGGYGPYLLGRAGSQVSAAALHFADGTAKAAVLQNGWYFLWWPANEHPVTISITTSAGTLNSRVKPSGIARVSFTPECQPGSQGCVFARTGRTQ
jgi:hypothetical protein